ncbi:MAG TPA: putative Ig domain-containing protein, partial [Acidimicrobiia bacterium]|nr:putative Ig domain-containing protein [Acidimicrobiia bacterium]
DRYLSPVYLATAVDLLVGDPPNRPPVIDPIAAQTVDEETTLTVPISVSDPDGDSVALSLSGEPAGASIVDGDLVWTPTEAQGPASYTFDVVADDGQGGTDTEEVTIEVAEVNKAPIVDSIDPITVTAGDPVFFTAMATDPDIPANAFTWSLSRGAPLGASIDPDTGEFSWGGAATAQRHTFSVIATDDGDPPMQGSTSVTIEVEPATVLISIAEQVGVADDPVVRPPVEIFVSEAVGVADDLVVRRPVEIFVSEAVGVTDDPVITTIQSGTVLGLRSAADGIVDGVVAVGDSVIFQGGGFAPDSEIIIELLSDPILLGTTTSDVDGRFSRQVIIPLVEPGEHLLVATGLAPAGNPHQVLVRLRVVLPADVSLLDFDPAVGVSEPGGTSVPFTLAASITTPYEDGPTLSDGNPMIELIPVGPGETVVGDCSFDDTILSCDFDEVPVNTYSVEASIGHPYDGRDEGVLVVYDPSLGFTTGGGWFYWPGTEDKASFGYTTKYNKKATNVQGSFLLIRHLDDGTKYRVKSNALDGLSLGSGDGFGWASFTGKATYQEPGWTEPVGNHLFVVYAEDVLGDDDRFWLQVADKDGEPVVLSMNSPAVDEAVGLAGGNIVVPHTPPAGVE